MAKTYELVRKIAVLGGHEGGTTKELNIVRWGFMPPQIDIRRWKEGEPSKGITLNVGEPETAGGPASGADGCQYKYCLS